MIVTEEEAKTKVCCGGRNSGRYEPENDRYVCIASACMAWRWHIMGTHTATPVDRSQSDDRSLGYCGKAGKP